MLAYRQLEQIQIRMQPKSSMILYLWKTTRAGRKLQSRSRFLHAFRQASNLLKRV
jgi:hypothetical protein